MSFYGRNMQVRASLWFRYLHLCRNRYLLVTIALLLSALVLGDCNWNPYEEQG